MPKEVYRRIVGFDKYRLDRLDINQVLNGFEETIGWQIMQKARSIMCRAIRDKEDMAALMGAFCQVMEESFTWVPGKSGNAIGIGAQVLDGEKKQGECGVLANALLCLLRCPSPYGFGVGSGVSATVKTYPGAHNLGFIARHEREFYRLGPNVLNPDNDSESKYYLWENHKVLHYCGRYWDVCYNRSYQDPAGMAQGEIVKEEPARGYVNTLFEVETGQSTKYYIYNDRRHKERWAGFIGPYDGDPGRPPAEANVNPPQVGKFGNCCVIL